MEYAYVNSDDAEVKMTEIVRCGRAEKNGMGVNILIL